MVYFYPASKSMTHYSNNASYFKIEEKNTNKVQLYLFNNTNKFKSSIIFILIIFWNKNKYFKATHFTCNYDVSFK